LRFDTKVDDIVLGGRLAIEKIDTIPDTAYRPIYLDLIDSLLPQFDTTDSINWTTHQVDITNHINDGNFYLTFRYTSTTTTGTAWFLDNINLTTTPLNLNVKSVSKEVLPLTIIGNSSATKIALSYSTAEAGTYRIVIYDMVGRMVYDGQIVTQTGNASYTIDGLNLYPGMYCVKMGNANTYGVTKLLIQ
jgi:hypothetical protein